MCTKDNFSHISHLSLLRYITICIGGTYSPPRFPGRVKQLLLLVELETTISLQSFKPAWNFYQVFMKYWCFELHPDPDMGASLSRHNDVIFPICGSTPLYGINIILWSCSNAKMNGTSGKSSKNWSRKWYGLLCFDENLPRYGWLKIHKNWGKCWISKINVISIPHISVSFHQNITNHTIFWTSFSRSFHWHHSFMHLSNLKKW